MTSGTSGLKNAADEFLGDFVQMLIAARALKDL